MDNAEVSIRLRPYPLQNAHSATAFPIHSCAVISWMDNTVTTIMRLCLAGMLDLICMYHNCETFNPPKYLQDSVCSHSQGRASG